MSNFETVPAGTLARLELLETAVQDAINCLVCTAIADPAEIVGSTFEILDAVPVAYQCSKCLFPVDRVGCPLNLGNDESAAYLRDNRTSLRKTLGWCCDGWPCNAKGVEVTVS